jgi:hypothetical protein
MSTAGPYEQIAPSSVPHILARNLKIIFTGKGKAKAVNKDDIAKRENDKKETIK